MSTEPLYIAYFRERAATYAEQQAKLPIPNELDEALCRFVTHYDNLAAECAMWRDRALMAEGSIAMAAQQLGGLVEGQPTHVGNYLQRIRELVASEAALREAVCRSN